MFTNPTFFCVYAKTSTSVLFCGDVPTAEDALNALAEDFGGDLDLDDLEVVKLKASVTDPEDGTIFTIDAHGTYSSPCGMILSIGNARAAFGADAD